MSRRYRNTKRVRQPCRVTVNQNGVVTFFAPENDKFFQEWSRQFTLDKREWDEERKLWKIPQDSVEEMVNLLEKHYRKVEGIEDLYQSPYDVLKLATDAPLDMVKYAAKSLRAKFHPDRCRADNWQELWPTAESFDEAQEMCREYCQEIGEAVELIKTHLESQE